MPAARRGCPPAVTPVHRGCPPAVTPAHRSHPSPSWPFACCSSWRRSPRPAPCVRQSSRLSVWASFLAASAVQKDDGDAAVLLCYAPSRPPLLCCAALLCSKLCLCSAVLLCSATACCWLVCCCTGAPLFLCVGRCGVAVVRLSGALCPVLVLSAHFCSLV